MSTQLSPPPAELEERTGRIIGRYPLRESSLVQILQDLSQEFNYLPPETLDQVATRLDVHLSKVYGVATFYKAFSLEPRGLHCLKICTGTACHVRGAATIQEEAERLLGIEAGTTTKDGRFTLETVNCVGACAMAPVVIVDEKYHRNVKLEDVKSLLETDDEV